MVFVELNIYFFLEFNLPHVFLNKNGVLMNDKTHKNLHEAILFIEQNMTLPAKSIELKSFVL